MSDQSPESQLPPDKLEPVLEFIKDSRGVDFTGYKRTTLGVGCKNAWATLESTAWRITGIY
jgi:hypothetical protein